MKYLILIPARTPKNEKKKLLKTIKQKTLPFLKYPFDKDRNFPVPEFLRTDDDEDLNMKIDFLKGDKFEYNWYMKKCQEYRKSELLFFKCFAKFKIFLNKIILFFSI